MKDEEQDKKKEKKKENKDEPKNPFFPFGFPNLNDLSDEQLDQFADQFKKLFGQFGEYIARNLKNMDLNEMMKQFNTLNKNNPLNMPNMEDLQREMEKMFKNKSMKGKVSQPFIFGFKTKVGPNGMPEFEPFGNVRMNKESGNKDKYEVNEVREPLTDIIEEKDEVIVVAEMPGCQKENIELQATKKSVTIIGKDEDDNKKFEVTLDLPCSINQNHAKANYKNGILEVKLQKLKSNGNSKKIHIE
ncbi:MAG: Hsp20 family protein [Candidatus Lokiarchaeota archaeon]|nr:Hsp20 family protein [Candidatus Lokiarchaeota archaeon]